MADLTLRQKLEQLKKSKDDGLLNPLQYQEAVKKAKREHGDNQDEKND